MVLTKDWADTNKTAGNPAESRPEIRPVPGIHILLKYGEWITIFYLKDDKNEIEEEY